MRAAPLSSDTVLGVSQESSNEKFTSCGKPEPAPWFDEGGIHKPSWRVTVTLGSLTRTYWFQTEHGASLFYDKHRTDKQS